VSIWCTQGVLQNTLARGELANMGSQWVVFEATLELIYIHQCKMCTSEGRVPMSVTFFEDRQIASVI